MTLTSILILLTVGLPWLGTVAVWAVGYLKTTPEKLARRQNALAVGFSLAAAAASLSLLPLVTSQTVVSLPMGDYFGALTFVPDGLGVFLAAVAAVIGSLAVIFSVDYMHGETELGRYYALVLLFIGAMCGLVLTGSLLFMFVFWEITALCSYALISFYNDDPRAVAGGIKALIITQFGGVGLLAGALISYSWLGSYQISDLLARGAQLPGPVLAVLAFGFLAAAAAKSAQVPFQTWLPDAMEAPSPISALIHAATMVNAGVYLLVRFYPAFAAVPYWKTAVVTVGALSALLAAMMAMTATDLKRTLAYSTISQLGYMVYAVGVGGLFASQFHLLSHAVFKALLFLGAGAVIHSVGTRNMRHMGRGVVKMPVTRAVFIIGALALAGLPILNGFWSKELILEAGLEGGPQWAYYLMLFSAGLTAWYTFRMVWMTFFAGEPSQLHAHEAGRAMRVALLPLAFGALTTWLLAGPFSHMLAESLPFHEIEGEGLVEMIAAVLGAPATYLALGVIALGLAAWQWRHRLGWLERSLSGLAHLAENGFGFEWLNQQIVRLVRESADGLRPLQTGQLNWNMVGVMTGLAVVLIWLAWVI